MHSELVLAISGFALKEHGAGGTECKSEKKTANNKKIKV